MIVKQLIHPRSIVVVGGSKDIHKPGGKVLKNLIDGRFDGKLYVMNPNEDEVQGIKSYKNPEELPDVDLSILAIAAKYTPDMVEFLAQNKNTRAFIVLSAGFGEVSLEGKLLEDKMVAAVDKVNGTLIGPNCVGMLTPQYHGVFTEPIPELSTKGCDFISGSGATACFIMETGILQGLRFNNVYSIGNSAQMGVEEVLKYMDETYDAEKDSHIKLLYLEKIDKPKMLLKHAASLISKGCRIAAVKAGTSEAGSRAASSHTGALATPDVAVDTLFKKAGIVRCYGREDLISVAAVFMHPHLKGKNIAVITHAGGPAVMLTDALSNEGLLVPPLKGKDAEELKTKLFPGSSIANPIDFLATGTAEQLGIIIDTVNEKLDYIDAMVVIFGTPGLFEIYDVYQLLDEKMKTSKKPIFPVLPSVLTAKKEVEAFVKKGRVFFPDEVILGKALGKIAKTPTPASHPTYKYKMDKQAIRKIIDSSPKGYLTPGNVQHLLDAAGIGRAKECVVSKIQELPNAAKKVGFPLVMKVVGPIHKSDVGGVSLNIIDNNTLSVEMERMLKIKDATAVLLQPMLSGIELFTGIKKEGKFGHLILFGLGGIFIEVLKDIRTLLAPVTGNEAIAELKLLKSYKIIQGARGQEGIDEQAFANIIAKLSALVQAAPEISEMDINPLLGTNRSVIAVDTRIKIG